MKLLPESRPLTNIWKNDFVWCNKDAREKVVNFWNRIPVTHIGMFLQGPAGTGKTTIAVNIANEWKRKAPSSNVVGHDFFDILTAIKTLPEYRTVEQNATLWNLQNSGFSGGLIVIDDFAAGRITEAAADTVETLIRKWEKKGTNVIFTSNIHPDKIVETFNEQLWSRICSMTAYVELTGKDWRIR